MITPNLLSKNPDRLLKSVGVTVCFLHSNFGLSVGETCGLLRVNEVTFTRVSGKHFVIYPLKTSLVKI